MRILSYLAALVVTATLSFLVPNQALAQSWKPLCVNGGNTAGAHNGTWQKINTPGAGGSTWKKAGGCIAPPPPTCANGAPNYPTCTFPPPAGRTITAGYDMGTYGADPTTPSTGYRGYTLMTTSYGVTSTQHPAGGISDRNINGATIAEMADYPAGFYNPLFEVVVYGNVPKNQFTSITINGRTVYSSDCVTTMTDPNRKCDYFLSTDDSGATYTTWTFYSWNMGMADGVTYPMSIN